MTQPADPCSSSTSRRGFLKTTAAAGAIGSLAIGRMAHAQGSDELKVGLIGCGGRGTGAAVNALNADANTKITAMADVFDNRLKASRDALKRRAPDRADVPDDHCFVGFDAFQKVIDSGVDVVILASTPHFRPRHLKAAIDAGKHVFCEKPVAVDAPGVRSVMETSKAAEEKGLSIVSGLCWRYDPKVRETMQRVLDGAIGDVHTLQETYLTGTLWHRGREPNDTEMMYQLRNWYYFAWLSGDFNTEQHVHSLDKGSWAMGDQPPARVWGLGGRQVRTDPKWGDIYDHHAVVYEYPDGARMYAFCRQNAGCYRDVSDQYTGTKGTANILDGKITGPNEWRYRGENANMYDLEHEALFGAIRSGKPINNGHYMALSTMLAIAGRMVNYTGQAVAWEDLIGNDQVLAPKEYSWDAEPPTMPGEDGRYPIAMPGVTKLG
jgi:predicted dehydrogenase